MLSRSTMRVNTIARRGFHTTRPQLSSPYHYPEGPRNNIPFNPMTRFFAFRYWTFMGMAVLLPHDLALLNNPQLSASALLSRLQVGSHGPHITQKPAYSLYISVANEEEQVGGSRIAWAM